MALKLTEFDATNFMGIKTAHIKPEGNVVQITGPNGAGKTSLLAAIYALLEKANMHPLKPMRDGCKTTRVMGKFTDGDVLLTVERTWTKAATTLTVNGQRTGRPAETLRALIGAAGIRPQALSSMSSAEQVSAVREVAGLDFTDLDTKRTRLYEERTVINRDVKALEGRLEAVPAVDAPDEPVDVAGLAKELTDAHGIVTANNGKRREWERLQQMRVETDAVIAKLKDEMTAEKQRAAVIADSMIQMEKNIKALVDPDTAAIGVQLAQAEDTNKAVRQKQERAQLMATVEPSKLKAGLLTNEIGAIEEEKERRLSKATMPVKGLGFGADGIVLNGIPFEQASSRDRSIVDVGWTLAINPKLPLVIIEHGSLYDAAGMKHLGEIAEKLGAQVLIERVADARDPAHIFVEDGETTEPDAEEPNDG